MHHKYTIVLLIFSLLVVSLPLGTAQEALAPEGAAGEIYYAPFSVEVTLDGDAADWEGVPRVSLSGGSHTVSFAAAANDEFLYLLGDVTDENIVSGDHGTDYWNEDSIEFYLNGTGDFGLSRYTEGVGQITVPPLNIDAADLTLGGVQVDTLGAQAKVTKSETGYITEVAVPLHNDVWDITPAHGAAMGFQVHLNATSGTDRDTKLIWSSLDTSDRSYQDPSVFGYLIFYEVGQTDLPGAPVIEEVVSDLPEVAQDSVYLDPNAPIEERVEDLLAQMSIEEKIAQMTLVEKNSINPDDLTTYGIGGLLSGGGGYPFPNTAENWAEMVNDFQDATMQSRLGIPLIYGVDAVHGHNNVYGAVVFPHNIGLGATGDPALVREVCRVTAEEMVGTGIYWNYAPVIAVPQDIRWGRLYEGYSENTDLVTEMGVACLQGLQGDDLADPLTVLATPKHYIGDGGTTWGSSTTNNYQIDQGVMEVDEETLRELYLPPYIAAVENGAQSIMISFSSWNESKMHAQAYLINDVLKGELGFEGFIVSDWGGIDQISPDYYESVVTSINAGVDMNMVPYDYFRFMDIMLEAVDSGDISEERIDDAVRRILTVKFMMGLFENPYANEEQLELIGSDAHRELARQAVAASQVLLKNENDALPLASSVESVFIAGAAADDIGRQSGGWTIEWQGLNGDITRGTTIREAIEASVGEGTDVEFDRFGEMDGHASVGIAVVGEMPYAEGVGDQEEPELSSADISTIENLRKRVDTLIVIIISGRPLVITDAIEDVDAVVAAWLPGSEGMGVADVLFGVQQFSGTLPYTWPADLDQIPLSALTESGEEPLFPLGYGLTTGPQ
jgi:beta-glucosidase